MGRHKGISLTQQFDSKVHPYVVSLHQEKLLERVEKQKTSDEQLPDIFFKDITVSEAVRYVTAKDMRMNRTKKSEIEKSVGRVLQQLRLDEEDDLREKNELKEAEEKSAKAEKAEKAEKEATEKVKKRAKDGNGSAVKRQKTQDRSPPDASLSQLGGMESIIDQLMELVGMPILHPEIYESTGVEPPRGVLLHGPPGCGKTSLANALAGDLKVPFISISAPSIVSGMSGESEKKIREIFQEARQLAPCLVFIDEIDAVTPKRDGAQREMEKRIVAQLLTCIDDLSMGKNNGKPVVLIGATNRPDAIDPALRRAGRFDREICLNVPDEDSRVRILQSMTQGLKLDGELDFKFLAKRTPGFVGADLKALASAAGICAIKRIFSSLITGDTEETETETGSENGAGDAMDIDIGSETTAVDAGVRETSGEAVSSVLAAATKFGGNSIIQKFLANFPNRLTPEQLEPLSIRNEDFLKALPTIQPTAKREGFATIPDVTWSNVGAMKSIRVELQLAIVQPIKRPDLFGLYGINVPGGVLLWGPPGCGKTLLAKAVANESRANFISVKGPELLNKYVGESERSIRQVFSRARASVPCVIFFDELDALVPKRDAALSESSSRVVNTLLTELDGLNDRKGIFVVGATNRPDMIDPAMLRPGRFDKTLYVELPNAEEKLEILKTIARCNKIPLDPSVDFEVVAKDSRLRFFSGADLSALVREAGVCALKRNVYTNIEQLDENVVLSASEHVVMMEDFVGAMQKVKASVTEEELMKYHMISEKLER